MGRFIGVKVELLGLVLLIIGISRGDEFSDPLLLLAFILIFLGFLLPDEWPDSAKS